MMHFRGKRKYLTIRNRDEYTCNIRSKVKEFIYRNPLVLRNYLKLKEIYIKNNSPLPKSENVLFKKVFIETVSYCNNDCDFCPASTKLEAKAPKHFMPEDLYEKILNELKELSFAGSLAFHCNNEPLLDERLASWVKRARAFLKDAFFYLYTNGTLIDVKMANQLFEAGLNRIIINNYSDRHKLIPPVKDLMKNAAILKGELIVNYRHKDEYLGNRAGESLNAKLFLKEPLKIMCIRPSTEMVIGYDGTVPLCCADGLWKVIMGNIKDFSISEVWFSGSFRKMRKSLLRGERDSIEICKVCDALNFSAPKGIR